ncbi:MAG: L-alanine-DL-glutamate epimerase-like enolase superfamily enzyme [Saprospiraceae bacterium]|jgi:L-alanine-DL-glutamate epimerase-like enolase superfamily enzyme
MKQSLIKITKVDSNFEREPLISPYRFKGSSLSELWQSAAYLESDTGLIGIGLATQSVLWSDAKVFFEHSENGGNALMYALSERALQMVKGTSFYNPVNLLEQILPEVLAYGKKITGNSDLRKTFALNALVGLDNALWQLYAQHNKGNTFDELIPSPFQSGLAHRHTKVASIPSFGLGAPVSKIIKAADEGHFIMKMKIGAAGNQQEMLEKDLLFLSEVHDALKVYETPYTKDGRIPYYFDANGRYELESLERFIDHAQKINAFDRIAVIEEPFDEFNETFVGDLGVCIAADESAHTDIDTLRRIEQGYGAIAVKAVAKTLSMTMKITQVAHDKKIPCFCADLTVNPILVDWNKSIAARLSPFPEMDIGLQETNGHQYYRNWEKMKEYHPMQDAEWTRTQNGVYLTGPDFYKHSGGIFQPSPHYLEMFGK